MKMIQRCAQTIKGLPAGSYNLGVLGANNNNLTAAFEIAAQSLNLSNPSLFSYYPNTRTVHVRRAGVA
jgi:hypothetical protein